VPEIVSPKKEPIPFGTGFAELACALLAQLYRARLTGNIAHKGAIEFPAKHHCHGESLIQAFAEKHGVKAFVGAKNSDSEFVSLHASNQSGCSRGLDPHPCKNRARCNICAKFFGGKKWSVGETPTLRIAEGATPVGTDLAFGPRAQVGMLLATCRKQRVNGANSRGNVIQLTAGASALVAPVATGQVFKHPIALVYKARLLREQARAREWGKVPSFGCVEHLTTYHPDVPGVCSPLETGLARTVPDATSVPKSSPPDSAYLAGSSL
jgi:hypothetical protein